MVKSYHIPLVERARSHAGRTAIVDERGTATYASLASSAHRIAAGLLRSRPDLAERRVGFLIDPGARWVEVAWGIWLAGGVAVPLSPLHPAPELEHCLRDADCELAIADRRHRTTLEAVAARAGVRTASSSELDGDPGDLPAVRAERRAMILYTSGTTGKPKGVVVTHGALLAQVTCLVEAWEWTPSDRILHTLPLHHVHGIVNALCCPLWVGATCEMLPRFEAERVWRRFTAGRTTVFMAVPTIYSHLVGAWEGAVDADRRAWSAASGTLRLMVSGSAALPVPLFQRWREITGHTLLERYGMTEFGMALSNPLHGDRIAGEVGRPLPGIEVRVVDELGGRLRDGEPGEIEVRGDAVFTEYWRRPEATSSAFRGAWFRTGDVAVVEAGRYRILGRASTDILKTGGYKVSALEIESVLREHPAIAECAVVGVPDPEWGERVAAAVVLRSGATLELPELRAWCKPRIAPYKAPSLLRLFDDLPRNAMGKVVKPELTVRFGPDA